MHRDDALDIPFVQVRQGDIIAEQKGQPAVVILEIQTFPHAGRQLVDKTENTFIAAGTLLVHQVGIELQPDVILFPLAQPDGTHPLGCLQFKCQPLIHQIKPIVEHILDLVPVDAQQPIPRADSAARRGRMPIHLCNGDCHTDSSSPSANPHIQK